MAFFRLDRDCAHSPGEAWRRLTTWERHADVVPLTRIRALTGPPTRVGTVFVARSGIGRLGFDDPMEVTDWRPPHGAEPGFCRLEKRGGFVLGWAEFEVTPRAGGPSAGRAAGSGGARVVWREELRVRWLPAFCDPLLAAVARRVFGRAADGLLNGA